MKISTFSISVLGVVVASGALLVDASGAPILAGFAGPSVVGRVFADACAARLAADDVEAARDAAAIVVEAVEV